VSSERYIYFGILGSVFVAYTACFATLVACASLHAVLRYLSILVRLGEVLRGLGSLDYAKFKLIQIVDTRPSTRFIGRDM